MSTRSLNFFFSCYLLLVASPALCQETETTLFPLQDIWVEMGGAGGDLGGQGPSLEVVSRENHRTYLQFSLAGLSGRIQDAVLKLYHSGGSLIVQAEEIQCRKTSDTWTESFMNGFSAPSAEPDTLATGFWISGSRWGQWQAEELTQALRREADGDGIISLVLMDPRDNITARRTFASSNIPTADFRPRLVITLGVLSPTPTATPSPTGTKTPTPTATVHPLDLSADGRINTEDLFILSSREYTPEEGPEYLLDFLLYRKQ
jgi:hypothetical protein